MSKNIYDFEVHKLNGEATDLSFLRNKVVLISNTASECGFTPQYKKLQALSDNYSEQDFVVLAFPSNQFGGQEPLSGEDLGQFCERNYGVSFPVFDKIDVKGESAHPLFQYLSLKTQNGKFNAVPKWNFQKYLINRKGEVIDYYYTTTSPMAARVRRKIDHLLKEENI